MSTGQTREYGIATAARNGTQTRGEALTAPRWQGAARVAFVLIYVLYVTGLALSIPVAYQQYSTICTALDRAGCTDGQPGTKAAASLLAHGISLQAYAIYTIALVILVALVYVVIGALIFWRRSNDGMALFVAIFLVSFGVTNMGFFQILQEALPRWSFPFGCLIYLGDLSIGAIFFLFPSGRFVPGWTRWVLVAYAAFSLNAIFPDLPMPFVFASVFFVTFIVLMAASQIYRYWRVSTPRERVQTKWVVSGFVLMVALEVAFSLPFAFSPSSVGSLYDVASTTAFSLAVLAIPVTFGIAITRSQLFDIDLIINRTLVYGSLTALLAGVYFGCVVLLQALARALTGQRGESALAIVVSTLLIAALFQPLRTRLQRTIDRRFYRQKYDAAKTLAQFTATLRGEVDIADLEQHLMGVIEETMQPTHVSLWLRNQRGEVSR